MSQAQQAVVNGRSAEHVLHRRKQPLWARDCRNGAAEVAEWELRPGGQAWA